MNVRVVLFVAAAALASVAGAGLSGCGPSAQVQAARSASYGGADRDVVFEAAAQAVAEKYEIDQASQSDAALRTVPEWYEPEGNHERKDADDHIMIRAGSIELAFYVAVVGDQSAWRVEVTPLALQVVQGSPQPRELKPDDPAMPGWVEGKLDDLRVAIHERVMSAIGSGAAAPPAAP
ncbi:MAG: hypothetical protein KC464_04945 [Myxococcales bacterium]|nr:hypothetical protein [Myxococcales bacterium]